MQMEPKTNNLELTALKWGKKGNALWLFELYLKQKDAQK